MLRATVPRAPLPHHGRERLSNLPQRGRASLLRLPDNWQDIGSVSLGFSFNRRHGGNLDIAFLRAERNRPDLEYIRVANEAFVVVMPSDHRLATFDEVDVRGLAGEIFIGASDIAGPMRVAIESYLAANGLDLKPAHCIHNLTMAMSLIKSTRGVALLPAYAENFLPGSITSRPLKGNAPTIDLVIGYNRTKTSPILQTFLSRVDQLKKRTPRSD
jgi:LysR family hca operon transcriptional activator